MAIDFEALKAKAKKKDEATENAANADFAKAKQTVTVPQVKATPLMTALSTNKTAGVTTQQPILTVGTSNIFGTSLQSKLSPTISKPDVLRNPVAQQRANRDIYDSNVRNNYLKTEMDNISGDINGLYGNYGEGGNVDYRNRKYLTGADMKNGGWSNTDLQDNDNVTTYTIGYYGKDFGSSVPAKNQNTYVEFTPIRDDGTIMTPQEVERYAESVLMSDNIKQADASGNKTLIIQMPNATDAQINDFENKYSELKGKHAQLYNQNKLYSESASVQTPKSSFSKLPTPATATTNYKPLAAPTSAQKMANVGINFKPTAQSQINTVNGISNKTITPTPMVQDKVTDTDVERGFYALGNVLSPNKANTIGSGLRYDLARGVTGSVGAVEGVTDFVVGGLNNVGSTITSLGGTKPNAVSQFFDRGAQYVYDNDVSGAMRKGIEDKVGDNKNWSSNITGELWDMAGNIIAASGTGKAASELAKVSAPVLSKAAFGVSQGGNSAQQAYNEGATSMQAAGYGNVIAAATIATESMFGGVPTFGKGVLDDLIKGLNKSPKAVQALVDMVGEGGEEAVQTYITPYLQRIYYNPEAKNATINEMLTSFAYGAGLSGIMQAPSVIGSIGAKPNIPSDNVNYTAQTGANNVQKQTLPMQNTIAPNLPKAVDNQTNAKAVIDTNVNANKANVSVQENVSVSQQASQAPTSDFKPQVATDTAKAVEVDTAERAKPEAQIKSEIQPATENDVDPSHIGEKFLGYQGEELEIMEIRNMKNLGEVYIVKSPNHNWEHGGAEIWTAEDYKRTRDSQAKIQEVVEANRKYEEERIAKEEAEQKKKAEKEDLFGFDDGKTPMQKGKLLATLMKTTSRNGKSLTRKDDIINRIADGLLPSIKSYSNYTKNGNGETKEHFVFDNGDKTFSEITKVEYDFAQYLLAKKGNQPTTEKSSSVANSLFPSNSLGAKITSQPKTPDTLNNGFGMIDRSAASDRHVGESYGEATTDEILQYENAMKKYMNSDEFKKVHGENPKPKPKAEVKTNLPNAAGAKITKGMPQGTGAASKNSLGGMGATKPTRFEINDDMNVDLNNLPQMSNQVVMNPQSKTGNFKTNLSNAYTHIVNVLNPIVKFSKVTGDNTAMLASNSANAGGTVSHIFDNALVDMNGNKIGTSLKEIANKVPKGQEADFWNYMMQRRNINKAVEDKNVIANFNSRMSAQYAKEVESRNPKWKSTGDEVVKWIADFEQAWGVNSGLIDQEFFNQLKLKDPNYVPAQREFTELESALTGGEVGKKFVDQRTPLKTMQGSERDINNPLENIMRLVNTTVKSARYNQVGQSLLKTIRSNPKASQYGEIVSEDEAKVSRANNIVAVIENGQKQYIRINDIALLDALNGIPKSTYTVPVISNLTTAFKKITTQDNPLFGITNLARDLPTGYIYGSQWNPFTYLLNEGKAFGQIAKNGAAFQRYKAVGGGMSSFFSSADAETAALNMNKTKNVFQKVGIGFNKFNSMIEEATRLNEFSAVLSKTGDVQKALNAANDVTVNFSRGGDIIKTVDRNGVPYLNASIQGIDKLGKAFMPERVAKTLFTGVVGITLPTLILYLFNRDNPYYDELSNRTKDTYFVIPNMFGEKDDNGNAMTFFKIPKSRELGMIFGALAERIAREVDGEDEAFKGFAGALATNVSPTNPLESGLIAPLIGLKSNKDFAGRTIIPQSMQDRSKSLQFDEKTSELTKFIAEYAAKAVTPLTPNGIQLSPKEMDYLIDSWTGVVGDFLLPATTKGANALSPITNKFTADPRYSSQTITDFYDKMDEAARKANDKNFAEGLDSETVTLEEKISSNYAKASKEISALSKTSARAGVEKLTGEDVKLLKGYGIDTSAKAQDIQKAIRTQQNEIAKSAISRGTKADEMELDLNNNSTIAKSVEKYQSAGYTQKQAYNLYKTVEALDIDGDSNQAEVAQALEKSNLSNKDKGIVWEIKNGKPSEKNPFTGTLAQAGLAPEKTIAIMEAYGKIDTSIDDNYVKQEGMPGAAQVKAAYLNQWLANQGYNSAQITYITDVFTTWQMIPIDKPSSKANAFVSANPMP